MKKSKVYALCEGAIMVALATALSYVKLMELPQGGSVCIGMLPLFIYFYRWDWKHSFLAAFAYGLLQLIFDGAYAWGPTSMLLDYVLAFTVLGVATFFRKMKGGLYLGATVACVCRFLVHFISGVTIYRINEPTELFNSIYTNPWLYSAVYNGSYVLIDLVLCLVILAVLSTPMRNTCAVTISRPCRANKPFFRKAPAKKAGAFSLSKTVVLLFCTGFPRQS